MFEVKVPRLAESISEGTLVAWLKQDGESVKVDEAIATLETDKAAVEIPAEQAGVLHHAKKVGETVEVGDVIATIDANGAAPAQAKAEAAPAPAKAETAPAPAKAEAAPAPAKAEPAPAPPASAPASTEAPTPSAAAPPEGPPLSPSVRRMVDEHKLDAAQIPASGRSGRLLKEDVEKYLGERTQAAPTPAPAAPPTPAAPPAPAAPAATPAPAVSGPGVKPGSPGAEWREGEEERLVPMSRIRQRTAERLVQAQHTAAILTTFNEVDMTAIMDLRTRFKDSFEKRHGVRLSFMSFFGRACTLALAQVPEINAEVRGTNLAYHRHVHLGIAVGTPRGLVVPVVRNADQMTFPELEREIARMGTAARDNKLTIPDLQGGTFTISNGGVYGSLLSTPILNPPQSGILGMHKIEKRPIVVDDQIVVRPMMYLALSYDHRIVDGEQAVTFLVRVKEQLEDPERMLLDV